MLPHQGTPYKAISVGVQPEIHEIIHRELSPKEYHLERAENLNQFTGILKQGIPDIVYMAADAGELDPFVLSSRLAKAGIAVLMISQTPTRELLIKAARSGAMDVLVSPLQPAVAVQKTDSALIKKGKKAPPEGLGTKIDFGAAKTPYEKVKIIVKNVKEMLALPFAVVKILGICNDPSANAQELEKPVKSDPAIAAVIMRRANSAAFAGSGQTTSIQRAVLRIGMRATRNIAASFSVFKLFTKEEKSFGFNRVWFWVHSLTTGICAQILATRLKYPQPDDAFLAGLLHDIGKMVLDDFVNAEFDKALRMANEGGSPIRMAEKSVFETDHAYIGSKIADSWGFPSVIGEGIGRHHLYERLTEKSGEFSVGAIVCMANHMAKALQAGSGGDHIAEREASSLWKGVPKGISWRKIAEQVFDELKAYTEVLEIPPEQFRMDLPQAERGKAGIFLPKGGSFGSLLQIALEREGLEPVLISSLEAQDLKEKGMVLAIGDLTSIESAEEAAKFKEGISSIHEKHIILQRTNGKDTPINLDFFWLESQLRQALGPQG